MICIAKKFGHLINVYKHKIDEFMLTPYGPPSPYALILAIPNECVGLIIGKGGDTIRHL